MRVPDVAGLMMSCIFAVIGLVIWFVVLALLSARDRRRDRAAAVVLYSCATAPLRGLIAVRVHAALLSRRTVAFLDMPACVAADVWPTMRPLADVLPPDIVLVIETSLDRRLNVSLPSGHPAPVSADGGGSGRRPSQGAILIPVR